MRILSPTKFFILLILLLLFVDVVFATPEISIEEFEKEVLIEKGWMKYLSLSIKNSGDAELHNVTVSIEGRYSEWFEVQTNKTDILPNETKSFLIKSYIPFGTEVGSYPFSLFVKSDETTKEESFEIKVFATRTEIVLYQIQNLRDEIKVLEDEANRIEKAGKDVKTVRAILNETNYVLDSAETFAQNNMFNDATVKMIDAEDLIKKAEYELTIASPIKSLITSLPLPLEWIIIIILSIIIIAMSLFFTRSRVIKTRREAVRAGFERGPAVGIKKMILEGGKVEKIKEEIGSLREAQDLIEEEYKQNLISKESYEELKAKYEEKILDLEDELRKG